jgi:mannose/cellobiose epimerase-like protein (N-acyl-D-glucosamine 2-epimerase family)
MGSPQDQARDLRDQLKAWLTEHAYPLWATAGRDAANGGFYEKIDQAGAPVAAPRRARVVTRQTYAYAVAGELGWEGPWRETAEEGLRILQERYLRPDGLFRILVDAGGAPLDEEPAPYEQAFAMLALSAAHRAFGPERGFEAMAVQTREALAKRLGRPDGGFYEALPHAGPLRANPHMHLLEAALAWAEAGEDAGWLKMARGIAETAMARMIDRRTEALPELFDEDWRPLPDADVEPGHQFEWGWLLLKYARLANRPPANTAALNLIDLAESRGVELRRGVAFNALDRDLKPRDLSARLWPQTERLKAALAAAAFEPRFWTTATLAAKGLFKYLDTPVPGLWRDRMKADGAFVDEPAPASSFYHIVGAILDLDRAVG